MNLGQLNEENEKFVSRYKEMGYRTKTHLANDAFALLRRKIEKANRAAWLTEAFTEIAETKPDIVFEGIEGDDFETEGR